MKRITGFTLGEVTVVMIVISVLVTAAIPNLTTVIEKSRAGEGEQFLYSLLAAQKRYAIENNDTYADLVSDLDLVKTGETLVPTYFQPLDDTDINKNDPLATLRRIGDSYRLKISSTGVITCDCGAPGWGQPCETPCRKIGYQTP